MTLWKREAISVVKGSLSFSERFPIQAGFASGIRILCKIQIQSINRCQPDLVVRRFKEDFNFIKLWLLTGERVDLDQTITWRKSRDGFPRYLYPFSLIQITWVEKSLLITQLRCYRKFNVPMNLDLESVVKPSSVSCWLISLIHGYRLLRNYQEMGMSSFRSIGPRKIASIKPLSSIYSPGLQTGRVYSAGGPNGVTLLSRVLDILALQSRPVYLWILNLFRVTYNQILSPYHRQKPWCIHTPRALLKYILGGIPRGTKEDLMSCGGPISIKLSKKILGRITYFLDGAGRMRIIVLGNCIIQMTLYPLHILIMRYLSAMKTDATYNQDVIFDTFRKYRDLSGKSFCEMNNLPYPLPLDFDFETWMNSHHVKPSKFRPPYSLDLSRATDRIPLSFQLFVLWAFTSRPLLGITWYLIMNLIRFHIKLPGGSEERVGYATGQGMGLYSSWAMLALTHHCIVKYSAWIIGVQNFKDYLILGDDIVIFHEEIAAQYIKVMTDLGVGISLHKTVKPDIGWGAEFASKLVHEDEQGLVVNLSPYPLGSLFEGGITSYFQIVESILYKALVNNEELHQFAPILGSLPCALKKFNEQRECLSTMWAISWLYRNWYAQEWSQGGYVVLPPKGVTLDIVTQYLLDNCCYPLEMFMVIDKGLKSKFISDLDICQRKIIKYGCDYSYISRSLTSGLYDKSKALGSLQAWTELLLFLQSPWYSVMTIFEDLGIQTIPSTSLDRYTQVYSYWQGLENPCQRISELLVHDNWYSIYENILLLSWGPGGILQKRVHSRDPLVYRVSKAKKSIILKNSIIFKIINVSKFSGGLSLTRKPLIKQRNSVLRGKFHK
uniref:RNA-dependent RNA polymerase n=1 Tax=Plasmopara viticola lesion associated mitovirus 56 TaxID=2719485 RepID=A0A6G9RTE8_9VIRU|nr:RNA-dependent RNA polymerase [Plasmopara viticola lesion associated mitovirus 56]